MSVLLLNRLEKATMNNAARLWRHRPTGAIALHTDRRTMSDSVSLEIIAELPHRGGPRERAEPPTRSVAPGALISRPRREYRVEHGAPLQINTVSQTSANDLTHALQNVLGWVGVVGRATANERAIADAPVLERSDFVGQCSLRTQRPRQPGIPDVRQ